MIPLLMVPEVPEAIAFYTQVLDFALMRADPADTPFYAVLGRSDDELQLNLYPDEWRSGGASFIAVCGVASVNQNVSLAARCEGGAEA